MVEFAPNSTSPSSLLKNKNSDPLHSFDSKPIDYSFADSFLDYDSLNDWIDELTSPVMAEAHTFLPEPDSHLNQSIEESAQPVVVGSEDSEPLLQASNSRDLNCFIEEGMSKVSLVIDGGSTGNIESESQEEDGESDVESKGISSTSASSSSSSSSSDSSSDNEKDDEEENSSSSSSGDSSCDDEEEKSTVKAVGHRVIGELEEGEIGDVDDADEEDSEDEMVLWDGEDPNGEDEEAGIGGPINSKNELKVLPPVPQVHATLQPRHQMLPVGVVLSIMGNQVIVEGVEKHNPLNEGSILWLTEARSPLGLVDEIFGPVKNPYYSVRYNSESEVPTGISGGTHVSFVLEFSDYVLNNKDLYKKGYDASGMNDEEVTDDDEFSDDEKELEFKKMQRLAKRGMTDNNQQINGNRNSGRKKKNNAKGRIFGERTFETTKGPDESRKYGQPSPQQASFNKNQHNGPPLAPFVYHGGCPDPSGAEQCFINGTGVMPSFPPTYNPCFNTTMNGIRPTEMPFQFQQQQIPFFPNGLPMNGMPWLLQNPTQQMPQMHQMPMMNTFAGAAYPQGFVGTSTGMPNPLTSVGPQGIHSGGLQFGYNQNLQPATQPFNPTNSHPPATQQFNPTNSHPPGTQQFNPTNSHSPVSQQFNPTNSHPPVSLPGNKPPRQFNQGSTSNQGSRPHGRGGSHFRGRRGGRQTR